MNRSETFVKCPKCHEEKILIISLVDIGSYNQPPHEIFEISQECNCNISEEEMDKYYDLFMELGQAGENIGWMEHEMVMIESELSSNEDYLSEAERESIMKVHDLYLIKIENVVKQYKNIQRQIYGENFEEILG